MKKPIISNKAGVRLNRRLFLFQCSMRINHKFLRRSFVKVAVAFWRVVQRNDSGVDGFCDLRSAAQDRFHEIAVILHGRCLSGDEGMGFCPA